MKGVAPDQSIHCGLEVRVFQHDISRYIDVTAAYQLVHIGASERFTVCNGIKRMETCLSDPKVE